MHSPEIDFADNFSDYSTLWQQVPSLYGTYQVLLNQLCACCLPCADCLGSLTAVPAMASWTTLHSTRRATTPSFTSAAACSDGPAAPHSVLAWA